MNRRALTPLFVIISAGSLSLLVLCSLAIFVRQDISHPESMVQWAVSEVAAGEKLYPDIAAWPHRLMPYGPLLCYPLGLLLRLLDVTGFGFHIYLAGRFQSLMYLAGIIFILSRFLVKSGFSGRWAVIYSGAYMALWSGIMVPSTSFRADFPGLFWAMVAAYMAFGAEGNKKKMYLALIPFMLSVAYKPSFWAFPAAFCIFYWIRAGFKPAFLWGLSLVGLLLIYIGVAQVITKGLFLMNQVGGSSLGLNTQLFVISRDLLLNPSGFPVLTWDLCGRVLLAVAAAIWILRRHPLPMAKGVALYFLAALPVNLITFFKVGAGLNYGLEAYVLSGLVLGIAGYDIYCRWPEQRKPVQIFWSSVYGLLFLLPVLFFTWINIEGAKKTWDNLAGSAAQARLMDLPPTALLGDQAFTHPAEEAHALSDPVPFAQLSVKGLIPKEPLTQRIQSQAFSHFVMSAGMKYLFFSPDKAHWVGAVLEQHYTPATVVPEYEIWVPKESIAEQTTVTLVAPALTE